MLNLSHKKLDVWKLSRELIKVLYILTESFPKTEIFGITNQIRRAVVSICSNIAEGASRSSKIERKRFYQIASSSLVEVDAQLEIAVDLGFVKIESLKDVDEKINHLFAKISNLINKSH
ncbi:MAG: four helix bundle protein [Ignavibacteria bacterium]